MNAGRLATSFLLAALLTACAQQPPKPAAPPAAAPAPAAAPVDARVTEAQAAALPWLALADAGKYADTWEPTAATFRRVVPKEGWEPALRSVREPLGALKSRTLKKAEFKAALPGAPDGEYVVVQYDSVFEKKAAAIETVTLSKAKEADGGKWQVSGYYLR